MKAIEQSRTLIAETMEKQKIPGLSIAVAIDGRIVWSEAFGFADLENQIRTTPKTRFRIASISKTFTAAAMAKLYEQGKLDIDAPVQKYVPNFPQKEGEITSRQLVGHLSGIRHLRRSADEAKDEFYDRKKYFRSVSEELKFFENDPLDFPPGTKYGYSNFGFSLLSAVIEGAAKKDFLTYVKQEVFDPLNMPDSAADENSKIIPNRSAFYSLNKEREWINAPYIDQSRSWAGSGFLSTSEDLVRYGSAFLQPGYLKAETLKEMFTLQKTKDGKETEAGFAWRIKKDSDGRVFYNHPGENVGGRSYLVMYPKEKVVVAMLHNITGAHLGSIIAISKHFVEEVTEKGKL
ncbi:MAG: serine hydrolase domain-containing protein [Pyrinomonadaceae bacterium]